MNIQYIVENLHFSSERLVVTSIMPEDGLESLLGLLEDRTSPYVTHVIVNPFQVHTKTVGVSLGLARQY